MEVRGLDRSHHQVPAWLLQVTACSPKSLRKEAFFLSASMILQITGYVSLVLSWLLPDHIPPWNTFPQEALATLAVFLLWPWRSAPIWPIRLFWAAAACVSLILLQYALQLVDRGDFVWSLLLAVIFCMAASLGAQAFTTHPSKSPHASAISLYHWFAAILAAALLNTVIGLTQWQGTVDGPFMHPSPDGRVFGNLAQPNQFASLLVLGLSALIYLDQKKQVNGIWPYIAALLLTFTLAASESRTGALSITLLAIIVFLRRGSIRSSLRWLGPAVALFWTFYANWNWISPSLGGSATRAGIGLNASTRVELWHQMIEAILLHPWLGYGWLNTGGAQQAVAHYIGGTVNMDHAHNLFLDFLIWFGLPTGGLLTIACIIWGLQALRAAFQSQSPQADFIFLCLLPILPIGVHSMLEYPYAYMYFIFLLAFFAGAIEAAQEKTLPTNTRSRQTISTMITLCGLAGAVLVGKEYIHIEQDFRALRMEREFYTRPDLRHTYAPPPILLTQFGQLLEVMRRNPSHPADEKTLAMMQRTSGRFPWLMTAKHHYLLLMASQRCSDASRQYAMIQSLYGRFGILKTNEDMERFNVQTPCTH